MHSTITIIPQCLWAHCVHVHCPQQFLSVIKVIFVPMAAVDVEVIVVLTDRHFYLQAVGKRVLSRRYHVRTPRVRQVTMTSEEYDSPTPLPVIPNLRQVRSVEMTPSAPEQRCARPPGDSSLRSALVFFQYLYNFHIYITV